MASLETLPADQRAVLALVLQRGRSYDEIADMLSIDRAAVRDRALQALDALGPGTQIDPGRRALITDYLLGQLPARVAKDTHDRLAQSAPERAWARVIASELSALAPGPLPEIPAAAAPAPSSSEEPVQAPPPSSRRRRSEPLASEPEAAAPGAIEPAYRRESPGLPTRAGSGRRSSRRGGAVLLAVAGAAVLVLVLILILNGGGSKNTPSTTVASSSTTTTGSTGTGTGTTTAPQAQPIGQVNLSSPVGTRAKGIVAVFRRSGQVGILISAQHVPPTNGHDAYAVWLFNSPSDSHLLGFGPVVASNGRLSSIDPALPANASHYKQLIVTRETARNPAQPGTIVLQGSLANVPLA